MPIPKPKPEETQDKFMERCMSDEIMQKEYPNEDQRSAVCLASWRWLGLSSAERSGAALVIERVASELQVVPDSGEISGYALTWEFDKDGIRFEKGSFAKSIKERAGKIPLMISHMRDGCSVFETVGFVENGEEDEKGLFIRANFLATPLAQATRKQAIAGGIKGLSIQARPIRYFVDNSENGHIVAQEAAFLEVTLTNAPLDSGAEIHSVRSDSTAATQAASTPGEPDAPAEAQDEAVRRAAHIALLSLLKPIGR